MKPHTPATTRRASAPLLTSVPRVGRDAEEGKEMSAEPTKPHERQLTEEEQAKVERVTTFEQFRGVVYKFKGERKLHWEDETLRRARRGA